MIGIDTNVMARYIMRDDVVQTMLADSVIRSLTVRNPGFLSIVVLVELWWILRRFYKRSIADCRDLFEEILCTDELTVEDQPSVSRALSQVSQGADFADSLISALAQKAGCLTIVTFDRSASRHAGMTLLTESLGQSKIG